VIQDAVWQGPLKNIFPQVTVETFDSRIANAGDGFGLWVTLAVTVGSARGYFHGLTSTEISLQEAGRKRAGGRKFPYMSRDDITADSANLNFF
jgi:hypothetical protein